MLCGQAAGPTVGEDHAVLVRGRIALSRRFVARSLCRHLVLVGVLNVRGVAYRYYTILTYLPGPN
jgi:hypothetical protein